MTWMDCIVVCHPTISCYILYLMRKRRVLTLLPSDNMPCVRPLPEQNALYSHVRTPTVALIRRIFCLQRTELKFSPGCVPLVILRCPVQLQIDSDSLYMLWIVQNQASNRTFCRSGVTLGPRGFPAVPGTSRVPSYMGGAL